MNLVIHVGELHFGEKSLVGNDQLFTMLTILEYQCVTPIRPYFSPFCFWLCFALPAFLDFSTWMEVGSELPLNSLKQAISKCSFPEQPVPGRKESISLILFPSPGKLRVSSSVSLSKSFLYYISCQYKKHTYFMQEFESVF